jgi:hypothetical protein
MSGGRDGNNKKRGEMSFSLTSGSHMLGLAFLSSPTCHMAKTTMQNRIGDKYTILQSLRLTIRFCNLRAK